MECLFFYHLIHFSLDQRVEHLFQSSLANICLHAVSTQIARRNRYSLKRTIPLFSIVFRTKFANHFIFLENSLITGMLILLQFILK